MDTVLQVGQLRLCLRPEWGGRVMSLHHSQGGNVLLPINDTVFDPEAWPRAGAYPLAPFHNRIEGAHFSYCGREAHLPVHPTCSPHALHGMSSRLPWKLYRATECHADLGLDWAADRTWPWSFSVRQVFDLDPQGINLSLLLTNTDDVLMPGGLGWHPYLERPIRLLDDAQVGWLVGLDYLPASGPVSRDVLAGETLYLAQWRRVIAELPSGLTLTFHSPEGLPHLVIHQPTGRFTCIEPVSHLANALASPGAPDIGAIAPGATLTARFRLEISY